MSRLFGELRQVGIVVRDIEAAMKRWVEVCGVGPWFYADRLAVTEFSYRGTRYDDVHISIALADSGDVQLELIQQRCTTPTKAPVWSVVFPTDQQPIEAAGRPITMGFK